MQRAFPGREWQVFRKRWPDTADGVPPEGKFHDLEQPSRVFNEGEDLPVVLNTNLRSLNGKTDEFALHLQSNEVAIAGVTETWCNDMHPNQAVIMDGYNIIRRNRTSKDRGGGVACYIRSTIPYKEWHLQEDNLETLWITVLYYCSVCFIPSP